MNEFTEADTPEPEFGKFAKKRWVRGERTTPEDENGKTLVDQEVPAIMLPLEELTLRREAQNEVTDLFVQESGDNAPGEDLLSGRNISATGKKFSKVPSSGWRVAPFAAIPLVAMLGLLLAFPATFEPLKSVFRERVGSERVGGSSGVDAVPIGLAVKGVEREPLLKLGIRSNEDNLAQDEEPAFPKSDRIQVSDSDLGIDLWIEPGSLDDDQNVKVVDSGRSFATSKGSPEQLEGEIAVADLPESEVALKSNVETSDEMADSDQLAVPQQELPLIKNSLGNSTEPAQTGSAAQKGGQPLPLLPKIEKVESPKQVVAVKAESITNKTINTEIAIEGDVAARDSGLAESNTQSQGAEVSVSNQVQPGWYLQVRADTESQRAIELATRVKSLGEKVAVHKVVVNGSNFFRILVGPKKTKEEITKISKGLAARLGLTDIPFAREVR